MAVSWSRVGSAALRAGGTVVAAVLAFAILAPVAQAGTYTINATGGAFCALGQFKSNVPPGFPTTCAGSVAVIAAPRGGSASGDRQLFEVDSPNPALTIINAVALNGAEALGGGYGGGTYWNGGGADWGGGVNTADENSGPIVSPYWGFQMVCGSQSGCAPVPNGQLAWDDQAAGVTLTVSEDSGPSLAASGLWSEADNWVWNTSDHPWPLTVSGSDPSGVCDMGYSAGTEPTVAPGQVRNPAAWQQCPNWTWNTGVDTERTIADTGTLPLTVTAVNAAGVSSSATETINVDNIRPRVTLTAVNDPDPTHWSVNHGVTLQVGTSTGPSGISSLSCSDTINGATTALTLSPDASVAGDDDVTVDGNGVHDVSCVLANNAVDPSGAHDTGSTSQTVDIDEQPPSLSFAPADPMNANQVVADVSDHEAAVTSGTLQIAPAGASTWTAIPTTFAADGSGGGHLIGTIPDDSLPKGAYVVEATATSQVGNTASTSENLVLPLRSRTTSITSFAKVLNALTVKRVRERVRVGWHWAQRHRHGRTVRVRVGGHFRTITVTKRIEKCRVRRVRVSRHRWKLRSVCHHPRVQYKSKLVLGHGKRTAVFGALTTTDGLPIAGQSVDIQTAPDNGRGHFSAVRVARTNADGGWKAVLGPGPSRTIRVTFGGSGTQLPATSVAHLYVPAKIRLWATPRRLPWRGSTTLRGRLVGGYVPHDGVAMRLLIKLPGRRQPYSPAAFRTTRNGAFRITWSWGRGSGVLSYPFSVATTATESDYPFLAARSHPIHVTFGLPTPRRGRG